MFTALKTKEQKNLVQKIQNNVICSVLLIFPLFIEEKKEKSQQPTQSQ